MKTAETDKPLENTRVNPAFARVCIWEIRLLWLLVQWLMLKAGMYVNALIPPPLPLPLPGCGCCFLGSITFDQQLEQTLTSRTAYISNPNADTEIRCRARRLREWFRLCRGGICIHRNCLSGVKGLKNFLWALASRSVPASLVCMVCSPVLESVFRSGCFHPRSSAHPPAIIPHPTTPVTHKLHFYDRELLLGTAWHALTAANQQPVSNWLNHHNEMSGH